jgi:hypothetical protein
LAIRPFAVGRIANPPYRLAGDFRREVLVL